MGATLQAVTQCLGLVAACSAAAVAVQRRAYRPVAAFLVAASASDATRKALAANVFTPWRAEHGAEAMVGAVRAAFHVEQALFLIWPFGILALALHVFLRARPWLVASAWLALVAFLATSYPEIRGASLATVYRAVACGCACISVGAFVMWWRTKARLSVSAFALSLVVAADVLTLFGPHATNIFTRWPLAQGVYLVLYVGLTLLHIGASWTLSFRSS